jgi:hypothetical protein
VTHREGTNGAQVARRGGHECRTRRPRRVEVVKIGTAYETGMRTRYAARYQPRNEVVYDAVLGFRYRDARPE